MTEQSGIISYGAYLPHWRLRRAAIAEHLGTGGGKGTRAVAGYDEDTTTMGVEAARAALATTAIRPDAVYLATAEPAYQDKTNATTLAAALGLDSDLLAADLTGAVRSSVAALRAGLRGGEASLVVLADLRTGRPGSAEERDSGDGAAALLVGPASSGTLLAEYLGGASVSEEFLDRWRQPGSGASQVWEERFGEQHYVPLAERALERGLKDAGVELDQIQHVVVTGLHARAVRTVLRKLKVSPERLVGDLSTSVGNTGAAAPGLLLSAALDRAAAGDVVAVMSLADGADVMFFRATAALAAGRPARSVAQQAASGDDSLAYSRFLTWRGHLAPEPPRRPDPDRPAAPPSSQFAGWKFGLAGSRCACGHAHLPPQRACVSCGRFDEMTPERFADTRATVATFTVDHLAFSPSPPTIAVVVDFDGGGRFTCELTDADRDSVGVGTPVEMSFRRLWTAGGVHNYFWKARPVAQEVN